MEEPPRPRTPKPVRTSKFSQTFSRFRGIIRIPARRAKDDKDDIDGHPYSQTRSSLGAGVKPYMSQPMLGLRSSSMDHSDHDGGNSSDMSASPDRSPSRAGTPPILSRQQHTKAKSFAVAPAPHSRKMSTHSLASGLLFAGSQTALGAAVGKTGLPTSHTQPHDFFIAPSVNGIKNPSVSIDNSKALSKDPLPSSTKPTLPPKENGSANSGFKGFTKTLSSKVSKPRLKPSTSRPSTAEPPPPVPPLPRPSFQSATTTNVIYTASDRPSTITYGSTPALPAMPSGGGGGGILAPEAMLRSISANNPPYTYTRAPSSTAYGSASAKPPRLVLPPPNHRFSLTLTGANARLSPSVVLRPPPLPIMNLPRLPIPSVNSGIGAAGGSAAEGSGGLRRRVGLKNMPALPLQGTMRGVGGQEEADDGEEEDEEDDDGGDGDDDADDDDDDNLRTSMSTESGMSDPASRKSYDTSYGGTEEGVGTGSWTQMRTPVLPPLETSPLDTSFFRSSPPSAVSLGGVFDNGKGKSKVLPPLPSDSPSVDGILHPSPLQAQHPTFVISSPRPSIRTSFISSSNTQTTSEDYFTTSHDPDSKRFFSNDRTPNARLSYVATSSPLRTPRPGDHLHHPHPLALLAPQRMSDRLRSLPLNAHVNGNSTPSQHPGMYKRASRSLIDIHALEKRVEVERIVWEQEEEVGKEQRKERVKLKRARESVLFASGATNAMSEHADTEGQEGGGGSSGGKAISGTEVVGLGYGEGGEMNPERERPSGTSAPTRTASTRKANSTRLTADLAEEDEDGRRSAASLAVNITSTAEANADATAATKKQNRLSMAPAYDALSHPLRRRRSMPMFNETTPPPPYPSFAPHPFGRPDHVIMPREDEGREKLPVYSNDVYLKAIMPRKMEFSEPGVQARDRKWKRVMCVLEGTMLRVYKCPVGPGGVSAMGLWWESKVGAGDVAVPTAGSGAAGSSSGAAGAGVASGSGSRVRAGSRTGRVSISDGGAAALNAKESSTERDGEKMKQQYFQNQVDMNGSTASLSSRSPTASRAEGPYSQRHRHEDSTQQNQTQVALTKSALNLAVQFLKPGSRHGRSNSDVTPPSPTAVRPSTPRASLNLPRSGTTTPTSSTMYGSRSQSPMPSSSYGSRSHSPMPSSSSNLSIPSPTSNLGHSGLNSGTSSRPDTPTSGSSRSRHRMGGAVPSSAGASSSTSSREFHNHLGGEVSSGDLNPADLMKTYTMQNAESGLGNDYMKRKNVIRVRLEGEQFLLQAKDVASTVKWIEGLQAATNISLDLDVRPMPRGPIFPRRRRRRRPEVPMISVNAAGGMTAVTTTNVTTETYTPTSVTAGQPVLRRTQ